MEKQKIFWVILSVTVFVVVVLVAGLFLLKSRPDGLARAGEASPATGSSTGIYEFGRDASSAEGDTEVLRFVIGDGGGPAAGSRAVTSSDAGSGVAAPATAAAASTTTKPAATTTKPAATAPTAKPAATAPTAKPAATAPTAKPAATARGPEYWIQTGSYKSQSRAEDLSQSLTAKGLAGRVFSFVTKGETYFRVRIGPYTKRQEAEKFLAIVKKIEGLEASYISLVSANRSTN